MLVRPFQQFARMESAGGILLLAMAALALVLANSPSAPTYFAIRDSTITVDVGVLTLSKPLMLWINDGLMAVFFFVVGLEIKREVLVGELSEPSKAALPVAGAIGGMLVPALIYFAINPSGAGAAGWGIPMATDIAFALGVLALLGPRVPLTLKVFVTAVAIVDDLGAVLVIALFYTAGVSATALGVAAAFLVLLFLLNRAGVRLTWPYAVLGLGLWLALLKSGIHATLAGVLLALTIPAERRIDVPQFLRCAERYLESFREDPAQRGGHPTADQQDALHSLQLAARELETPLQRMEHALHPWVVFFVVPVFALANAGVALGGDGGVRALLGPITLGVALGLVLGKPVGILAFAWLATRLGVAALPVGVGWRRVAGVSLLCGIGFTMSLFIAGLALGDAALLDAAKIGVLAGSLVSGVAGAALLVTQSGEAPPSGLSHAGSAE